jgi:hypothetical protein
VSSESFYTIEILTPALRMGSTLGHLDNSLFPFVFLYLNVSTLVPKQRFRLLTSKEVAIAERCVEYKYY